MKKSFKALVAVIAAITAMTLTSTTVFADKLKVVDGVTYGYSDSGEVKGKYTGWARVTRAGTSYRTYYEEGIQYRSKWVKVDDKSMYYIKKDGRMATGDLKIDSNYYFFDDDGKLMYGVKYTIGDVTATGASVVFRGICQRDANIELLGGEAYKLQRKNTKGKWEDVTAILDGDYAFTLMGYELFDPDGKPVKHEKKYNWKVLYGELSTGEYRFCTSYDYYPDIKKSDNVIIKNVFVPFIIK